MKRAKTRGRNVVTPERKMLQEQKAFIKREVDNMELEEKSSIIKPGEEDGKIKSIDYGIVVKVGETVHKFDIGDIVMKCNLERAGGFSWKGKKYALLNAFSVSLAVKPENFEYIKKDGIILN